MSRFGKIDEVGPLKNQFGTRIVILKFCKSILFLCCVILFCAMTSFLTTIYFSKPYWPENFFSEVECHGCDLKTHVQGTSTVNEYIKCCLKRNDTHNQPTAEKLVDGSGRIRIGAQLSVNQTALNASPPRLSWSHEGADNYLEGLNHVLHYRGTQQYDCLEVTRSGRYLIAIQLTYRYTATQPETAVKCYFTLTKFRDTTPSIVAKSTYVIPSPGRRIANTVRQPITMVRSDPLQTGDRICITASHPRFIYASMIDNFFGVIYL